MAKGFKIPHLPYYVTPTDEIDLKQKSAKILLQLYKKQQRSSVSFKDEVKKIIDKLDDDIDCEILLASDYLNLANLQLLSKKLDIEKMIILGHVIDKISPVIDLDNYTEIFLSGE